MPGTAARNRALLAHLEIIEMKLDLWHQYLRALRHKK